VAAAGFAGSEPPGFFAGAVAFATAVGGAAKDGFVTADDVAPSDDFSFDSALVVEALEDAAILSAATVAGASGDSGDGGGGRSSSSARPGKSDRSDSDGRETSDDGAGGAGGGSGSCGGRSASAVSESSAAVTGGGAGAGVETLEEESIPGSARSSVRPRMAAARSGPSSSGSGSSASRAARASAGSASSALRAAGVAAEGESRPSSLNGSKGSSEAASIIRRSRLGRVVGAYPATAPGTYAGDASQNGKPQTESKREARHTLGPSLCPHPATGVGTLEMGNQKLEDVTHESYCFSVLPGSGLDRRSPQSPGG
jgi:hypothetical protein